MVQIEALSPSELHDLEIYKSIVEGKPLNHALTLDDIEHVKTLIEELKIAEEQDKPKLEKIDKLESVIEEKQIQLETLRSQLNQKLLYIKQNPTIVKPIKTVNHTTNTKPEYSDITEANILDVLKTSLVYGGGNSQIADALHEKGLNVENSKGAQNKIYSICKKLQEQGKITNVNRMWKLV